MNEDFIIKLTEEDVQDFSAIFKIDLLRTLSEAIKRQILLNKDYDLSYFLRAAESDMAKNGAKMNLNLDNYTNNNNPTHYSPRTPIDVFKSIIPLVSTLISTIRRNMNIYPSYLVTGLKTASMLRSMQDMGSSIPDLRGEIGFNGSTSQFLKLKVLESVAIEDNKIYMSTKASQDNLEKSTIVDFVFQPLYIVKEITNAVTKNYVRSRTLIEVLRTDGLGCIELENIERYVG